MKPVIIIRPQPGCDASLADARALGLPAYGFPLSEIRPLPWETPDPEQVDALLFGSANAVRHGGAALAVLVGKPAYAVGEKTAAAARASGFDVIETGHGSMQDLLGLLRPGHRRLLRPAGEKRVELNLPEGTDIDERTVYASESLDMPAALVAMLSRPAVVLLHSGEAARHFAMCCDEHGLDRSIIALAAMSDRAAGMAGEGWADLKVAKKPEDAALLALARQMCQETRREEEKSAGSMEHQAISPPQARPSGARGRARSQVLVALLAFVLGAVLVGWLGWNGYLDNLLPQRGATQQPVAEAETAKPTEPAAASAGSKTKDEQLKAVGTVEGRLAMLEDRLSRLDLQANAASGNAARAEGLLIAFATRRMVDRGEPLRYLSDQLRLRFANAQPRAVETIIKFSEDPVTIDELSARLEALEPQLTKGTSQESLWNTITREVASLFVLRSDSSDVMTPKARIDRARVMLTAHRIPEAIEQVESLPGAQAADNWVVDARRYAEVQSALDLIETAAMLEPRKLKDSEGKRIDQPSPLATPVEPAKQAQKKPDE